MSYSYTHLLDLLTRMQAAGQPIDMANGDEDARIPAALWREFVDAHAAMLYENARTTATPSPQSTEERHG